MTGDELRAEYTVDVLRQIIARVAAAARSVRSVYGDKWPWHLRNGHRIPIESLTVWVDDALACEVGAWAESSMVE